jgi:SAM-dependent methyltransferase
MGLTRSAEVDADFLLPHLTADMTVVDVGCGDGELSVELAAYVGHLVGIDADSSDVELARRRAQSNNVTGADFEVGDAYALPVASGSVDAVFGHSVLEALDRLEDALAEMWRVLKPGGVVGVASVEYGGLLLSGPNEPLLRRFYDIREELWLAEGAAPYRGRELRGLLLGQGFARVDASTRYISYGTEDRVREFGLGRADDCQEEWYVESAQRLGLATGGQLARFRSAWLEWSESPTSYAAFAWCRALGWRP